jgi:KRAB domain-containing zinc finger protein
MTSTEFECTDCGRSYKYRGNLTSHQRLHNGTAFACDLCERQFNEKRELEQHFNAHTSAKPYACDVNGCEKMFTQMSSVITHKREVHEYVPGKYRCEVCQRAFVNAGHLKRHRLTHTNERAFACKDCPQTFKLRTHLQVP